MQTAQLGIIPNMYIRDNPLYKKFYYSMQTVRARTLALQILADI